MNNTFQPKLILIYGLAREGLSSYRYIHAKFPHTKIIGIDDHFSEEIQAHWQDFLDQDKQLQLKSSQEFSNQLEKLDVNDATLLCKSAGIPAENALITQLKKKGCRLTSNTQLFFDELSQYSQVKTIAITGTKGKSTTTALIGHVLHQGDEPVFVAGNIGKPALDLLEEIIEAIKNHQQPRIVLELSSHQLRELVFSPHIAVLLDITPEHLDYYPSFEAYWQAKAKITINQKTSDYLIFNPNFVIPVKIAKMSLAQAVTMGDLRSLQENLLNVSFDDQNFYLNDEIILSREDLHLLGEHNALNALPALWIGKYFDISEKKIKTAFQTFKPLDHRLQIVAEINEVLFVNDSQGTTPEASMAAIQAFQLKPIILLAGGSSKGANFEEFSRFLSKTSVKALVLFPPEGEKIEQAIKQFCKNKPKIMHAKSMTEAVLLAWQSTQKGDVVLLSPACASFGLFTSYIDRGNQFIEAVKEIKD